MKCPILKSEEYKMGFDNNLEFSGFRGGAVKWSIGRKLEQINKTADELYKNNNKLFILDIETKPQQDLVELYTKGITAPKTYKDEEKIKEYIENKKDEFKKSMSVDTDYADIICIGIKSIYGKTKLYTPKELEVFFKENPSPKFITFNGKKFDIPLLIKQGLKNNLNFPYKHLKSMTRKWNSETCIDLQEVICDNDYKSLDKLLQIYLGISKKPIDFNKASEDEIREHCIEDLNNTHKLYNIFNKII